MTNKNTSHHEEIFIAPKGSLLEEEEESTSTTTATSSDIHTSATKTANSNRRLASPQSTTTTTPLQLSLDELYPNDVVFGTRGAGGNAHFIRQLESKALLYSSHSLSKYEKMDCIQALILEWPGRFFMACPNTTSSSSSNQQQHSKSHSSIPCRSRASSSSGRRQGMCTLVEDSSPSSKLYTSVRRMMNYVVKKQQQQQTQDPSSTTSSTTTGNNKKHARRASSSDTRKRKADDRDGDDVSKETLSDMLTATTPSSSKMMVHFQANRYDALVTPSRAAGDNSFCMSPVRHFVSSPSMLRVTTPSPSLKGLPSLPAAAGVSTTTTSPRGVADVVSYGLEEAAAISTLLSLSSIPQSSSSCHHPSYPARPSLFCSLSSAPLSQQQHHHRQANDGTTVASSTPTYQVSTFLTKEEHQNPTC